MHGGLSDNSENISVVHLCTNHDSHTIITPVGCYLNNKSSSSSASNIVLGSLPATMGRRGSVSYE